MAARLKQYSFLILALFCAAGLILLVAYYFAQQKSEPDYLSKIDRLMFKHENEAPKVILTLPDYKPKKELVKKDSALPKEIKEVPQAPKPQAPKIEKKELTVEEVLAKVPNYEALKAEDPTQKLKYIEISENLSEKNGNMILPKIAANGKKPWSEYGVMVKVNPQFKKVGIIIKGMGFDDYSLNQIVAGMPSEVSLSFSPYGQNLKDKIVKARSQGHETYVDLLLSSHDFLKSDSGPMSMSLTITEDESLDRLYRLLNINAPIGGIIINDGIADETNQAVMQKILQEVKKRGLLMVDTVNGDGIKNIKVADLPRQKADVVIEGLFDKDKIQQKIKEAEEKALKQGQVLLAIENKPVIVMEVYNWIKSFSIPKDYETIKLEKKENKDYQEPNLPLTLVPVSNLVLEQ